MSPLGPKRWPPKGSEVELALIVSRFGRSSGGGCGTSTRHRRGRPRRTALLRRGSRDATARQPQQRIQVSTAEDRGRRQHALSS